MKKAIAFIFVMGSLLGACNLHGNKEHKNHSDAAAHSHHEHAEAPAGLVLNNGAKWKADAATNQNVQSMKEIAATAHREKIEDYQQAANQLNEALDKMISECAMQGPDHEALHQWLEPLIEKVSELKKATEATDAALKLDGIEKHIALYEQYFE